MLKIEPKYMGQIGELIQRFPCFEGIKDTEIWEYDINVLKDYFSGRRADAPEETKYHWEPPRNSFFDYKKQVSILPVMFVGKTGYGKSSLLNYIIGKHIFATNDIRPCTKQVEAAFFRLGVNIAHYLTLIDFPGVGEGEQADKNYMNWYADMVETAPCIVYVLRADQRDFSLDEKVFGRLFPCEEDLDKVIIALNFADKIEPIQRGYTISEKQKDTLEKKAEQIERIFSIPFYRIFPCCAHTGYGVEDLVMNIEEALEFCTVEGD